MEKDEGLRGKLTIRTRRNMIPAVTGFVHEAALSEGLTPQEAGQLEVITEEACLNVMQHAFEGRENAFLDVFLERRPGQFVISVEDKGLPFDWKKVHQGEKAGFGISLMKAFTDEIRYINLGRGGKRLEMIKNFSYGASPAATDEENRQALSEGEALPADAHITFRQMEPDEGVALARCIYRGYGYTYGSFAYFPEKVRELLLGGLQESLVAVTPDGEIVAHQALVLERPDSRIPAAGAAVFSNRSRRFPSNTPGNGDFTASSQKPSPSIHIRRRPICL
jgi:anti-sigma regulatory factor (Ser/Thr protein kinase)